MLDGCIELNTNMEQQACDAESGYVCIRTCDAWSIVMCQGVSCRSHTGLCRSITNRELCCLAGLGLVDMILLLFLQSETLQRWEQHVNPIHSSCFRRLTCFIQFCLHFFSSYFLVCLQYMPNVIEQNGIGKNISFKDCNLHIYHVVKTTRNRTGSEIWVFDYESTCNSSVSAFFVKLRLVCITFLGPEKEHNLH